MPELTVPADAAVPTPFGAARRLFRLLIQPALSARPALAADFAPELAVLLPERCADLRGPRLGQIALGATKRRLHPDSERLFRVVDAFAVVAAAGLTGPDTVRILNAEYCDRLSLACLRRLLRTSPAPPKLILETASPSGRPDWAWTPTSDDPALWTDAASRQAELFERFVEQSGAEVVSGSPVSTPLAESELLLAAQELAAGDAARAARRALRSAQRAFGFTLHYELILSCCRIALASRVNEARMPALQFAGLAHAYLGANSLATEVFEAAFAQAPTPEAKAQTSYYLGLLAAKRRGLLDGGRHWFQLGMRAVDGRVGEAAAVERGWLGNGLAFAAWTSGQYVRARELVEQALAETSTYSGAQAANLRVNLTNNLSVLLEQTGDAAASLEIWRTLEPYEAFVRGGTFGKAYRFREAWLLHSLGRLDEAYGSACRAAHVAREHRDVFHTRLIGAACCYLAARRGDLDAAGYWAEEGLELAAGRGSRASLAHAYGQLAHVRYQASEPAAALALLDSGARIAARAEPEAAWPAAAPGLLAAAAAELRSGSAPARVGPDEPLFGVVLDRPKAKLSTPFRVLD